MWSLATAETETVRFRTTAGHLHCVVAAARSYAAPPSGANLEESALAGPPPLLPLCCFVSSVLGSLQDCLQNCGGHRGSFLLGAGWATQRAYWPVLKLRPQPGC
mmetsp:Transcript_20983/g.34891  ORF Transcript_20983/g.34891 Transcript_20983/m.34891 type:complete len:104 (+) Transcript_20983:1246-1557(+)